MHTGKGYLIIYPGSEKIILTMLSYPGRQVTSSCETASKRIQGYLEGYFKKNNNKNNSGEKEKEASLVMPNGDPRDGFSILPSNS